MDDERVVASLRALASLPRWRLLTQLETPKHASDLRIEGARRGPGSRIARVISRSAVAQHLDVLEKVGLVRRVENGYVVDQPAVYDLLVELGALARIRPVLDVDEFPTRTRIWAPEESPLAPPPRLTLVETRGSVVVFPLAGTGPWLIGRDRTADIVLEHDAYVSRRHALLRRSQDGFQIETAAESKNPVLIDFQPVSLGSAVALRAGAIVTLGRSNLVLQA